MMRTPQSGQFGGEVEPHRGKLELHRPQQAIVLGMAPLGPPPPREQGGRRRAVATYYADVNSHPALFWPSRRRLFRRRQITSVRIALWLLLACLLTLVAAGYLQLP